MEVSGKIIQKLPLQSGTSRAGNQWSKQIYVLETLDAYPKKVAFDFFGDRINQYDSLCEVGAYVTLSFDIESREYQGRWYTDIRGWKAEPYDPAAAQGAAATAAGYPPAPQAPAPPAPMGAAPAAAPAAGMPVPPPPAPVDLGGGVEDDLPF